MAKNKEERKKEMVKTLFFAVFIPLVLLIVGAIYAPDIYNSFHGLKGVIVSPSTITYNCGGNSLEKTISVTNYEDNLEENYPLTFGWDKDNDVEIEIVDLDNSLREKIYFVDFEAFSPKDKKYRVFFLSGINPKSSIEFDLSIIANCTGSIDISTDEMVLNMGDTYTSQ